MNSPDAEIRTPYEILGIASDATPDEIEEAYLFLVATYGGDSLAAYQAFDEDQRGRILAEIEGAYHLLRQPLTKDAPTPGKEFAGGKRQGRAPEDSGRKPPGILRRIAAFLFPAKAGFPSPKSDPAAPGTGLTVGETLRSVRKARGLALESVASATGIKIPYLEALEADASDLLPSGSYRRLMLISYARFLNLRPEKLLTRFPEEAD